MSHILPLCVRKNCCLQIFGGQLQVLLSRSECMRGEEEEKEEEEVVVEPLIRPWWERP